MGAWTQGRKLYHAKCRSCHQLIKPDKHTDEEWESLVARYGEKLDLSEEEKSEMLQYLQENN